MRKFIMTLVTGIALLVHGVAYGQINAAEYFYDTDPGVGHGTPLAVTTSDSVDITTSLPTTGLGTGFHNLYIRTRNTNNRWSLYVVRNFYLSTPPSVSTPKIVAAEYFIDADPGIGNGTPISTGAIADSVDITTNIPTTGLSIGFHNLYIRTRNADNRWSLYAPRNFYVSGLPVVSSPKIVAAEYFIDADPGVGSGTPIPTGAIADSVDITTAVPTAGLSIGFHNLFIRTRNTDNRWSLYAPRNFYVAGIPVVSSPKIVAAEYFIDTDPGIGNGTAISTGVAADSVDITAIVATTGLSAGFHNVFIRTKNSVGLWSLYAPRNFYIQSPVVPANLKVVAAEYFIDADPGVGNGTVISPSFTAADSIDLIRNVSSAGLASGPHRLLIRTRNQDGLWSHAVSDSFNICSLPSPGSISGAGTVCVGATIALTNPVPSGTWSTVNGRASVTSTGIVSGVTAGVDTVRYGVTNTCGTAFAEKVVTVNPIPGPITTVTVACTGTTTTLINSLPGGTWASSNPAVASVVAATGVLTGGAISGTATITYTMPTGCNATGVVTVFASPAVIGGASSVCVGSAVTLTNVTPGGSWSSSTTSVATIGSSSGVLSGLALGTTIVSYTMLSGCIRTTIVTVNAVPAPIGGSLGLCGGATTTLTNATAGGSWTSGNLAVATIGTATGILTGGSAGTAIVTYTLPTGCIATAVVTVAVAPAAIGGVLSVCNGSTVTLTNTTPGGSWSSGTTSVATIGSASGILSGISAGTTIVSYAISGCARTAIVTVNTTPAPIGGSLGLCAGATTTLTNATPGGSWSSGNLTVASIGSTTGILTSGSAGTAIITYALPTGCNATAVATVAVTPAPIGGVLSVCDGSTATLTNTTPGGLWSSGTTSVATIGSASGILSGVSAGTTLISYAISGCTRTVIVTVNTTPAPIGGTLGLCSGTTTTLTNVTGGGSWTSGNPPVASIVSGTGVLTGGSAGTAIITYALPTGCNATAIVSVGVTPAAIGGVLSVCEGSTTSLTNTTPGGLWSSGTTSVATIGSASGILSGATAGTTIVSYVISGCSRTAVVTVNTTPASIGGTLGLCAGSTTTLTNATGGGTWTSGNPTIASIVSGTGVLTGASAGTATVTYALPTGCSVTAIVSVGTTPAAIGGALSVCEGSTITLTNTTPGGLWSSGATSVATIGSVSGVLSGITAGTTIISYAISGCSRGAIVTVNAGPANIGGGLTLCAGSITTLTNTTSGGTWTSSTPAIGSISTSGVVSGITAGTTTISYTIPSGCFKTAVVTVNPLPAVITGASSVCESSTATLTSGPAGGTWTSSNAATASVGNSTGIVSGIAAGTVMITYSLSTGCYRTGSLTVDPTPAPIAGPSAVCVGSSATLSSTTAGGSWSSGSTAIATVSASGVLTGVAAGTAVISYTVGSCAATKIVTVNALPSAISGTASVCIGSARTLSSAPAGGTWSSSVPAIAGIGASSGIADGISVGTTQITYQLLTGCQQTITFTVNPLPAAISGTAVVCAGSTTSLSNATPGGVWSSSSTSIATVGSASGVVSGVAAGTTTISYTLATGCSATSVVTVDAVPSTIVGPLTVCAGSSVTLSNSISGGTWSSSSGSVATIGASTGIVNGISTGTTQIIYQLPTGCAQSVTFTVNPLPATISGTTEVCAGNSTSLSSATAGGVWSSSSTAIATVGASGVATGVSAGTATISYALTTGCVTTSVLTVHALPAVITGASNVCTGSTVTLSSTTFGGTWSSSTASVVTIGAATGIVNGISAGTTQIMYQLPTGCQQTITFTVNPLPAAISGTTEVCVGSATSLSNTTAGGVWSSSSTATASVGGASGVVSGVAAGTSTISYALATGCYITSVVTVHALPATISGPSAVCVGSVITLSNATSGGTWSSGTASVATIGTATGVVNGISAGTTQITYQLSTGCQQTMILTVNPLPGAIAGAEICVGNSTTLSGSPAGGTWGSSSSGTAIVGVASGVVTGVAAGTASISYILATGCSTSSIVTVHATPASIVGSASVCAGRSVTLSSATIGGTWSSGTSSVATIDVATGIVNGLAAGTAQISYQLSTGCQRTITFTVNPLPAISGTAEVCVGSATTLSSATTGGTWSSSSTATATVDATSGAVTGVAAGTTAISYELSTGCSATLVVMVHEAPAAITGSATVCAGSSVTLSNTSSGGTWSSSAGTIATIGATSGILSGVAAGTSLVSYTLATGCAATLVVSVDPLPSAGSVSGADTVCVQETSPLSNSTPGGAWSSSDPSVATVSGEGIVTGVGAGSVTISYTVTNSCGAAAATHPLIVKSIADCATGVKNPGANVGFFRLYPNPAYGAFSVETSVAGTMSISSVDGKEIGTYTLKAAVNSLTLPKGTASGVYMCRFTGSDGSIQVIRLVYQP